MSARVSNNYGGYVEQGAEALASNPQMQVRFLGRGSDFLAAVALGSAISSPSMVRGRGDPTAIVLSCIFIFFP